MNEYSKTFRDAKESAENAIIVSGEGDNAERPDYKHPAYPGLAERMAYVRACHGGTETMRAEGHVLLPKMAREDDEGYRTRKNRTVSIEAVSHTASGLAGMIFRKDLRIEGPENTLADLDDVDLRGNDLNVFARRIQESVMRDGYGWIHVEAPANAAANREEEVRRNVRPYWLDVDPIDAVNWRYEIEDGQPKLALFVYREWITEDKGSYGAAMKECYRVLRPGSWQLWQKRGEDGKIRFDLIGEGQTGIPEVPVVFVPGLEKTPEDSRPAMQGIADLQVAWYQRWSLYNIAMDFAVPVPVITGIQATSLEFGAGRAIFIPAENGTASYLEMQGAALEANRQQLKDLEQQMAVQGLALLSSETRAAETAEAKRIDKSESDSSLSSFAKSLESALNQALYFHALYRRNEAARASVNRDFMQNVLDAGTIQVLSNMVLSGQLSLETLWQTLKQGEVLPDSFDEEMERELIGESPIMQEVVA